MMKRPLHFCLLILAAASAGIASAQATPAGNSSLVSELVDQLAGEFDSRAQMEEDKANAVEKKQSHAWINRSFVKVASAKTVGPALVGSTYYFSQPWIFDDNEFLVWTFTLVENEETVLATPRRFKDQTRRLAFARDAKRLSGFSEEDLEPARSGALCPIYWTKTKGGFEGEAKNCRALSTVHNKFMNWEWRYKLRDEALFIEFSGTDDNGKMLDGTPKDNPYRLDRVIFSGKSIAPQPAQSVDTATQTKEKETINAVLRTATIYVKDWDASIRFYTDYLGYELLAELPINKPKSLATIGAIPGISAKIAYLKPVNNQIKRPFAGNYLGLIGFSGPGYDKTVYQRDSDPSSAALGEVVLAHQVVGIDRIYESMQKDEKVRIVAQLSPSGAGLSRSFSVIDPNGVRVEIYEFFPSKEPVTNP